MLNDAVRVVIRPTGTWDLVPAEMLTINDIKRSLMVTAILKSVFQMEEDVCILSPGH